MRVQKGTSWAAVRDNAWIQEFRGRRWLCMPPAVTVVWSEPEEWSHLPDGTLRGKAVPAKLTSGGPIPSQLFEEVSETIGGSAPLGAIRPDAPETWALHTDRDKVEGALLSFVAKFGPMRWSQPTPLPDGAGVALFLVEDWLVFAARVRAALRVMKLAAALSGHSKDPDVERELRERLVVDHNGGVLRVFLRVESLDAESMAVSSQSVLVYKDGVSSRTEPDVWAPCFLLASAQSEGKGTQDPQAHLIQLAKLTVGRLVNKEMADGVTVGIEPDGFNGEFRIRYKAKTLAAMVWLQLSEMLGTVTDAQICANPDCSALFYPARSSQKCCRTKGRGGRECTNHYNYLLSLRKKNAAKA